MKINNQFKLKTYKDLIAWQKAYHLCIRVLKACRSFPLYERYGLTSQISRSAISIPSNIAEGYTRHQTLEYIRFLYIAYASLAELETQILIAKDLEYIDRELFSEIITLHAEVQRVLQGLIKSLKSRTSNPRILKSSNPKKSEAL